MSTHIGNTQTLNVTPLADVRGEDGVHAHKLPDINSLWALYSRDTLVCCECKDRFEIAVGTLLLLHCSVCVCVCIFWSDTSYRPTCL